jgi:hypothetical protein
MDESVSGLPPVLSDPARSASPSMEGSELLVLLVLREGRQEPCRGASLNTRVRESLAFLWKACLWMDQATLNGTRPNSPVAVKPA